LRAGAAMFFASGLLALLPSIAHRINGWIRNAARRLWLWRGAWRLGDAARSIPVVGRRDRIGRYRDLRPVDNRGRNATRVGAASCGDARRRRGLISFISLFNVQVLNQTPDWVRARALAVSMLVFQGAVAAGSATWGAVAARDGLGKALLWAGVGQRSWDYFCDCRTRALI
jgi:hypothetical protein